MSTIFWGKKSLCNIQYRTWSNIYKLQSPVCVQVSVCVCTLPTAGCPVSVSEALNNKWHSSSPTPPPSAPTLPSQWRGGRKRSASAGFFPSVQHLQWRSEGEPVQGLRREETHRLWWQRHFGTVLIISTLKILYAPLKLIPVDPTDSFFFPLSYLLVKTCFWWSNCTVMVVNEFARNSDPRRRNMDGFILTFFLLFIKETHALRYGMANNLQPYMWVSFFSYLLFNLYFLSSEFK